MLLHVFLKRLISIELWFAMTFFRKSEDLVSENSLKKRVSTSTSNSSRISSIFFILFALSNWAFSIHRFPGPVSLFTLFIAHVYSLQKTTRETHQFFSRHSLSRNQTHSQFIIMRTSILQNHSCRKIVPVYSGGFRRVHWSKLKHNFRGPNPCYGASCRGGLLPCLSSSEDLVVSDAGGSSCRVCKATRV